eukprot:TRINITY_DN179_c0_g2_i2.p1 TRINITY_DN179_c0_g2~~TRINITY_DN179_c0_g2_i2.p1  ORF type:complete len:506 (+),score=157.44 TRINITY_DN179_c0_g2_i2:83-1519(+)
MDAARGDLAERLGRVQEYASIAEAYAAKGQGALQSGDFAGAAQLYQKAVQVWDEGAQAARGLVEADALVARMMAQRQSWEQHYRGVPQRLQSQPQKQQDKSWWSWLRGGRGGGGGGGSGGGAATPRAAESGGAASMRSPPGAAAAAPAAPLIPRSASAPTGRGGYRPPQRSAPGSELLKRHDRKHIEAILNDVVDPESIGVRMKDVTGLDASKQHLREAVILPITRPELFSGLREPPKGVLLFGPPGNGKTLLAKAVAAESGATFFSISASSLVSKWVGEGEKMVRCLFALAEDLAPSVVFIDEVDSLLGQRGEDQDYMRRLKTEVLVQMDGVKTHEHNRVLVLAATNRPQDIDSACLRRFTKRVHIPLPDSEARIAHVRRMAAADSGVRFRLAQADLARLAAKTENYSYSDLTALVKEAAIMPVRELGDRALSVDVSKIRPVTGKDFDKALQVVRPSAPPGQLQELASWAAKFGTTG